MLSTEEIELPSAVTDRVHQIFLDPTGRHLIVCMNSQDSYYISLGTSAKKPKLITKLKVGPSTVHSGTGHFVVCVCFFSGVGGSFFRMIIDV